MYISWEGVSVIVAVLAAIGGFLPFVIRAIVRAEIATLRADLDNRFLATNIADLKFQPLTQLSARIDALDASMEAAIKAESASADAARHKLASRVQALEFQVEALNKRLEGISNSSTDFPVGPPAQRKRVRR